MPNCNPKKLFLAGECFLEKSARRPHGVFFGLLLFFSLLAAAVFYAPAEVADQPVFLARKDLFGAAKAAEYRKVFEFLKQREVDLAKTANTAYPKTFGLEFSAGSSANDSSGDSSSSASTLPIGDPPGTN